ncbi:MAG TPA: thiol-disulfide oxidoreductase DCC family protein [Planctomycetia bacterium]|nr:thiol-disulfide oxidoreductase DCC family protein [Planctomycetia bacterium]
MNEPAAILLYDGVCNFCDASVRFILKRDRAGRVRFAALQSPIGRSLVRERGLDPDDLSGIVLIEGDSFSRKSTAALRALRYLRFPWPLLSGFLIFPRFFRDFIYDIIAKHRYRWFGKRDACRIHTPPERARFLDAGRPPSSTSGRLP